MDGMDLASLVSTKETYEWDRDHAGNAIPGLMSDVPEEKLHVVAYDYGIKHNILRMLTREGCRITVVPAQYSCGRRTRSQARWHFSIEWSRGPRAAALCAGKYPASWRGRSRSSAFASATN